MVTCKQKVSKSSDFCEFMQLNNKFHNPSIQNKFSDIYTERELEFFLEILKKLLYQLYNDENSGFKQIQNPIINWGKTVQYKRQLFPKYKSISFLIC